MPARYDGSVRSAAAILAGLVSLNACSLAPLGPSTASPVSLNGAAVPDGTSGKYIAHIVIIIQENRSFDNFFAGFPGADGATQGLMKTPSGDKVVQLQPSRLEMDSLGHEHHSFDLEYDHGKMDGFNLVKRELAHGVKVRSGTYAYRYVEPNDIAPYWTMAKQYVLGDHMFPTQSSSSFTAHQDLIAGGTPIGERQRHRFSDALPWGCNAPPGTVTSLITESGQVSARQRAVSVLQVSDAARSARRQEALVASTCRPNTSKSAVWNAFDAIDAVRNGPQWQTNIVTSPDEGLPVDRKRPASGRFVGSFRTRSTPTIPAPALRQRTVLGRIHRQRHRRERLLAKRPRSSSSGTIGAAFSTT